jgi:predicted neuraminidase
MAETASHDGGKTWSTVKQSSLRHPTARFFLRRLKSGALLLVRHGPLDERAGRTDLMAFVSDDDGQTWKGGLMLDDREKVTYPDGVQAPDGTIYIVYDRNRTPNGEVLMATFNEDDVRAARAVTDQSRLRVVITQLQKANELSRGELK